MTRMMIPAAAPPAIPPIAPAVKPLFPLDALASVTPAMATVPVAELVLPERDAEDELAAEDDAAALEEEGRAEDDDAAEEEEDTTTGAAATADDEDVCACGCCRPASLELAAGAAAVVVPAAGAATLVVTAAGAAAEVVAAAAAVVVTGVAGFGVVATTAAVVVTRVTAAEVTPGTAISSKARGCRLSQIQTAHSGRSCLPDQCCRDTERLNRNIDSFGSNRLRIESIAASRSGPIRSAGQVLGSPWRPAWFGRVDSRLRYRWSIRICGQYG